MNRYKVSGLHRNEKIEISIYATDLKMVLEKVENLYRGFHIQSVVLLDSGVFTGVGEKVV